MITLDELRALAHPAAPDSAVPTVRLDDDDDVPSLFALFAADEPPEAVRLVIGGEAAGELGQEDVLELFPSLDKGFGSSGGAIVPGEAPASAYKFVLLYCPVADCPASPVATPRFDAGNPPTCDVHTGKALELRP
ncbi:MAG TPA: hypothetical protein VH760_04855 [Gaiellaceae bacterium]